MLALSNIIDSAKPWSPMQLRSLHLSMHSSPTIEDGANIIAQILLICPRLHTLVLESIQLARCLEQKPAVILSSLERLHLDLFKVEEMVDPFHLAAVFPNISYISTGNRYIGIDTNIRLGHVALNLIKALPRLRRLLFNEQSFVFDRDTVQGSNNVVVQMLQNSEQLRSTNSLVRVYQDNQLFIWL